MKYRNFLFCFVTLYFNSLNLLLVQLETIKFDIKKKYFLKFKCFIKNIGT